MKSEGMMRRLTAACIIAFYFLLSGATTSHAAESKCVEIKIPFANIYEYLDPKSAVVKQAKKGDQFELVNEGESWYQVKTGEKVGWLEKRAGRITEKQSFKISSPYFIICSILFFGAIAGVSFYLYRTKNSNS